MNGPFVITCCLISVLFICFVRFVLFPRLWREMYRSDIRRIRDRLFDYVLDNGAQFDEPAYRMARHNINMLIRVSNQLAPTSMIVSLIGARAQVSHTQENPWGPIPDGPLGDEIRKAYAAVVEVTVNYVFRSFPGLLCLVAFVLVLRAVKHVRQVREVVADAARELIIAPGDILRSAEVKHRPYVGADRSAAPLG